MKRFLFSHRVSQNFCFGYLKNIARINISFLYLLKIIPFIFAYNKCLLYMDLFFKFANSILFL